METPIDIRLIDLQLAPLRRKWKALGCTPESSNPECMKLRKQGDELNRKRRQLVEQEEHKTEGAGGCPICHTYVPLEFDTYPFCGSLHHEEWALANYGPKGQPTRKRTVEDAIARANQIAMGEEGRG
jgi:hypothetical protein